VNGGYLLDTSVFSQPLRRKPIQPALERWRNTGDPRCRVSIVSIGEVEWGLHLENHPVRWEKYRRLLEGRLQVLAADEDVWRRFAEMKARQQKAGHPVADFDLLIAATARVHQLIVATLNHADFSRVEGVAWENWGSA
jgi:predicted nucleic acid-binding protein